MKIIVIAALVAFASADVSHLLNQQQYLNYQYQNPAPENSPQSSYGVPQSSVLGYTAQRASDSSGSASVPQLILPGISGPAVDFTNGASAQSSGGVTIQTYNGFSSPAPSAELSGFQVSTPVPSFQVSTPAPNVDISSYQVSTPAPSVDLTGFKVSTPSVPSVNLVQYSQPPNSYQFLSKLSQPIISVPSLGLSTVSGAQFGSDALLNSGVSISSGQATSTRTSGGSINDAFGVVTDAAGQAEANQEPDVSKHLYFFAAPEEEEEEEVQAKVELPPVPPKKTYKIIFIKAPTYRNQATITIPAPPQNEEKTLVYVLVKKPEGQPKVRFQNAVPTEPSKPEVYFIKYKTQKEAEAAVAEIQSKHGASGHIIANLSAGSQAAPQSQSAGVTVSSTPSSVSFGTNGIASLSESDVRFGSGNFGGFDSLRGSSFISSTAVPASFGSRISEAAIQGPQAPLVSQPQENVSTQIGNEEETLQVNLNPSPSPVLIGGSQLTQVVGSGIAEPSTQQQQEEVSTESPSSGSEQENEANTSASEGSTDSLIQNVIQQRIGGGLAGDNQSQGSQAAGFSSYGPPNF